ncbi:MAG: hypothetical protein ACRDTT_03225 [Pseudonocardiaceae bacterium]
MPIGAGIDVADIAQTVLIGVAGHFAASGVDLPPRQVIAPGQSRVVPWDCESVVVTCDGIGVGHAPGSGATARQAGTNLSTGGRYTTIAVQIVRCVPLGDGGEPAADGELTDAGLAMMRDAGVLSQALTEIVGRAGPLKQHGSAVAGAVEFLGPEGGFSAVEGSVTITAMKLT